MAKPKINPQTLRKINLYRQNPDIVKPPTEAELVDLVVLVLNSLDIIDGAIKEGRLDGYTPQEGKDYMGRTEAVDLLNKEIKAAIGKLEAETAKQQTDTDARVRAALENIRDGKDGIVTEQEIARAAQLAAELIDLPDFEEMMAEAITVDGESIRNALELLSGDDRYKVEMADVDGLEQMLADLRNIRAEGGNTMATSKPAVYRFINDAINDGIIASSIDELNDIGDVEITSVSDGDVPTWSDAEGKWVNSPPPGASGGEANTASNVGTDGVGVFKQKSLVDLEFKNIAPASAKVTVTANGDDIDIDVDPSEIATGDLNDDGTFAAASHTHTLSDVTDSGALAALDTVDTAQIDDDAVTIGKIADAAIVTEAEGIDSNDNDTTLPTSAAVKDYFDNNGGGLSSVVEDTSPQLGGDLDAQDNDITSVGNITGDSVQADSTSGGFAVKNNAGTTVLSVGPGGTSSTNSTFAGSVSVSGNITVTGTVDGRDVATDGNKLDNIEAEADKTDATNVEAAGALMDSEVTNLAQVKAFDSSDYATAAQGALADSALQPNDDINVGEIDYDTADGAVTALGNLGATEAIDWSTAIHYTGTLDSNVTITHSNEVTGRKITLYLEYDGSAQRTITWSDVDKWLDNSDGSAPDAPSASGEVLVVTMQYIGTTCYASATGNYAVYS